MTSSRTIRETRRVVLLVTLTLCGLAAGVEDAEAQRRPGGRGAGMQDREELMQRVRQRFAEVVREQLGLTAEESDSLDAVVRSFDDERMALAREERAVRRRVEALVLEGGAGDEEARDLLTRMSELRAAEARLFAQEQGRLLEVLEPGQVLRFLTLRERMAQRLRSIGGAPPGPGHGGPPGMPPPVRER